MPTMECPFPILKFDGPTIIRMLGQIYQIASRRATRMPLYGTFVLDRKDGSTKFMQCGLAIIKQIHQFTQTLDEIQTIECPDCGYTCDNRFCPSCGLEVYAGPKYTTVHPGGKDGFDIRIEKTGAGIHTRYQVTKLEKTPFTDAEMEEIKKHAPKIKGWGQSLSESWDVEENDG